MPSIFVSYATADEPFVRELAKGLEDAGNTVFFSGNNLLAGQHWQDQMSTSLREADAVLIVVSQSSSESRWLMAEMGAALGYFQERGRPLVMPLVLDEVALPQPLAQVQAIFSPDRDLDQIIAEITRAMNAMVGRLQARTEEKLEVQARIEANVAEYIGNSLGELRAKEKEYKRIAYLWYFAALFALVGGVVFALWRAFVSMISEPTWQAIVHLAVASVIVVGLLGALSRFAFVLGKSFMVESLRNGDRTHAISFGQFYLKAFGDKAEWEDIKEAFQHWNIDSGSSFITQSAADIDPQIMQTAIEVAKVISGKSKDKN